MFSLLSLSTLLTYAGPIINFVTAGQSPQAILSQLPAVVPVLEQYVAAHFPKVAPEARAVAAIGLAYNTDKTKWIQGALNAWDATLHLDVDGIYGDATRNAAEKFQNAMAAKFGLKLDGWIGDMSIKVLETVTGLNYVAPKAA